MKQSSARLVLLPGMGADHRLFGPQRRVFPDRDVPDWLPPEPSESLEDYGRRMAATIDPATPFWLGGVSLGGMVALEMACHLRPQAVFLIGSCRSGRSVPGYLRFLERLSRPLPTRAIELSWALAPLVAGKVEALDRQQRRLVVEMLRDTPTSFIRWASRALIDWELAGDLPRPIHHIHGDHDRLLPISRVHADRAIEGGGHLINLTHPDAVNAFLLEHIEVM